MSTRPGPPSIASTSTNNPSDAFNPWEFVHCAVCFQPWSDPPRVPFWATDCGHIICNNHLLPDASCPVCGTPKVLVSTLTNDFSNPTSPWFQPVSKTFESLGMATRFQIHSLSSLVRHYRQEVVKFREQKGKIKTTIERFKQLEQENEFLRKKNTMLKNELDRYSHSNLNHRSSDTYIRQQDYQTSHTEYVETPNGKRRLLAQRQRDKYNANSSSPQVSVRSAHSAPTPMLPSRITLPTNRTPAPFLQTNTSSSFQDHNNHSRAKGIPENLQQFAYRPSSRALRPYDDAFSVPTHMDSSSTQSNPQNHHQPIPSIRSGARLPPSFPSDPREPLSTTSHAIDTQNQLQDYYDSGPSQNERDRGTNSVLRPIVNSRKFTSTAASGDEHEASPQPPYRQMTISQAKSPSFTSNPPAIQPTPQRHAPPGSFPAPITALQSSTQQQQTPRPNHPTSFRLPPSSHIQSTPSARTFHPPPTPSHGRASSTRFRPAGEFIASSSAAATATTRQRPLNPFAVPVTPAGGARRDAMGSSAPQRFMPPPRSARKE